jgi:predicted secreted protein
MKKGIALTLVCAVILFGCAFAEQGTDTSSMDVRFTENPSTGYSWHAAVSDGAVLAVIDNGYAADQVAEGLVGAGGTHSWSVIGLGKGEATALFTLTRGEVDAAAEATVGYACSVDKESRLTVTAVTGVPEKYTPGYAVVELKENPTTGYEWKYEMSAEGVLTPGRDAYTADTATGGEALMGAGGVHLWTFAAKAAGDVTLTYSYARSWEKDVAPDATVTFACHVDDAMNVTVVASGDDYATYNPYATETAAN